MFFALFVDSLDSWQTIVQHYGYWAVFFGILLENAGLPVPGETVTLVGGFLAGENQLNYWGVLGVATSGAMIGDNCGYWIGAKGGWPLLVRVGRFFRIPEEKMLKTRLQFQRNAGKAVLIGRFVALLRVFAGPLAGAAQMPYGRFLLFNALGASLWATVTVTVTYQLGKTIPLEIIIQNMATFAVGVLGLAVAGWILMSYWENKMDPDLNQLKASSSSSDAEVPFQETETIL